MPLLLKTCINSDVGICLLQFVSCGRSAQFRSETILREMKTISFTHFGFLVLLALLHGSEARDRSTGVTVQTDAIQNEFIAADEIEQEEERGMRDRVARSPWGFRLPKVRWGSNPFRSFRAPRRTFARNIKNAARNMARNVNKGARKIAKHASTGARNAARNIDKGARNAARNIDKGARNAARNIDKGARNAARNIDKGARNAARNVKETIKQLSARAKGSLRKAGQNLREVAKKIKEGEASTSKKAKKIFTFPENLQDLLREYLDNKGGQGDEHEGENGGSGDEGSGGEGSGGEGNGGDNNSKPTGAPTTKSTEPSCKKICQVKPYYEFFQQAYCACYTLLQRHGDFFTFRETNNTYLKFIRICAKASLAVADEIGAALVDESDVVVKSKDDLYKQCKNGTFMKCNSRQRDNKLLQLKCLEPCESTDGCVEDDKNLKQAIDQAFTLYNTKKESFLKLVKSIKEGSH